MAARVNLPLLHTPVNTVRTGMNESQIAVLVLDDAGRVTAANQASKTLWQTGATELVGEFFPGLFELDIVSEEPRMMEAQWDVLLAATLDKSAILSVQPREGAPRPMEAQWDVLLAATLDKSAILSVQPREGAPRPMVVRSEKAISAAGGYIVVIEAHLEPAAPPPAFPDDQAEALQLFAENGDVGFFDLNLKR